jgi:hypothetical protein
MRKTMMIRVVEQVRDSQVQAPTRGAVCLRRTASSAAALAFLVALAGCSSDDNGGGAGGGGGAAGATGDGGNGGSGTVQSEFEACMDAITPVCKTSELDTEEEMDSSCKATEFIPIPLTDGTSYGPVTIEAGPYGGTVMWNEGAGTEFVNEVNPQEDQCLTSLIDFFQEPTPVTDDLKNIRGLDYSLYTIFRPSCMKEGETYPVITWANGTCGLTHGYALLLGSVASHGYVIIASNSTWTNTAPTNGVQVRAIDYAEALNEDPESIFYQRLDLDHVGAMGHSQGAAATLVAASDPRVDSIIAWNSGASSQKPFLNVSGDRDIGDPQVSAVITATDGATQPGAWVFYHQVLETGGVATGHLVLMEQPDRVWELAVGWWDWQLKGDDAAKAMFVGDGCGLCDQDAEFEYGHNALVE